MSTDNFIIPTGGGGGTGSSALPTTQPATPGLWLNAGVLTFWSGVTNTAVDVRDDTQDVFGNNLGTL